LASFSFLLYIKTAFESPLRGTPFAFFAFAFLTFAFAFAFAFAFLAFWDSCAPFW
jgi:hypothetical protein